MNDISGHKVLTSNRHSFSCFWRPPAVWLKLSKRNSVVTLPRALCCWCLYIARESSPRVSIGYHRGSYDRSIRELLIRFFGIWATDAVKKLAKSYELERLHRPTNVYSFYRQHHKPKMTIEWFLIWLLSLVYRCNNSNGNWVAFEQVLLTHDAVQLEPRGPSMTLKNREPFWTEKCASAFCNVWLIKTKVTKY